MRLFSRKPLSFPRFTRAQVRGVLWLLPLLAVAAIIIRTANRPRFEKSFLEQVAEDGGSTVTQRGAKYPVESPNRSGQSPEEIPRPLPRALNDAPRGASRALNDKLPEPTFFDPNTLTVGGFEGLGFSRRQAEAIVRYRTARGGFREPEDLGKSYVVSPEMFARLRPYIRLTVTQRSPQGDVESPNRSSQSPGEIPRPLSRALNDVPRGASRALNDVPAAKIDLNTADSAALRTVRGIGEKLVGRIIDYRRRLGGYASVEQLREIPGMYPENFEHISEQIFVDSAEIQKIDVNFASPDVLGTHPYITSEISRKLLRHRQLKGGWSTTQELKDENILTEDQARRLGPYLNFKTTEK